MKKIINNKRGISLIVLVITILIMIILATTIIITISNTNIISKANTAIRTSNLAQYKEAVNTYNLARLLDDNSYNASLLDANEDSLTYNGVTVEGKTIIDIIPNMKLEDIHKYSIIDGEVKVDIEKIILGLPEVTDPNSYIALDEFGNDVDLNLWTSYTYNVGWRLGRYKETSNIVNGKIIGNIPYYIKTQSNEGYVIDIRDAFSFCDELITAPLIPSKVNEIYKLFYRCSNLTSFEKGFKIPDGVIHMNEVFSYCTSLITLPEDFVIPSRVSYTRKLFYNCTSLTSLPDGIRTGTAYADEMFRDCTNLTSLPENFKVYGCYNIDYIFASCNNLKGTITMMSNPDEYTSCFYNTGITSGGTLTVNYARTCQYKIDSLIATKNLGNVTKGVQIN